MIYLYAVALWAMLTAPVLALARYLLLRRGR